MNGLTFKVTDSRKVDQLTEGGHMATVHRVWLQTDRGATGSFDVANEDWTTEKLPALFAKFAEELDLAFMIAG